MKNYGFSLMTRKGLPLTDVVAILSKTNQLAGFKASANQNSVYS